ncbi:cytochrome b-c1 complex subunit 10, mitochondrial [[Candida] railenensis]|uniref:Cytochrome b-c1 complex subunit 10, mitochondrial n=1 Tax=[Candida] railenensis TaxID=45579 RepID=A0A9P0QNV7_9ASCO|nr:cytochrome b-c1 complex subunit 10, mitochondrial [[Candida] railenensis]
MVSYIKGPAYKSVKSFAGANLPLLKTYAPNLILWGGAAGAGVATFTSGVPIFKSTFYAKIPYFGDYFTYNPDPEDVPI